MARAPNKERPRKPPTASQRNKAHGKRQINAAGGGGEPGCGHNAHIQMAQAAWAARRHDEAIRHYERALALEPASPERPQILSKLAIMYERLHDLDAARDCAEEALAMAPQFAGARITLALLDRREDDSESALSHLMGIVESKQAPPTLIADAWYQLASMHDQSGNYHEAFNALTEAKQILDKAATGYRENVAASVRTGNRTLRAMTPEHFHRWHAARKDFNPLDVELALLTGHPRSGTTLLEQVLDSHPGLISADEIPILSDVVCNPLCKDSPFDTPVPNILDQTSEDRLALARQDYLQEMQGALREPIGRRMLLDKNPAVTSMLPIVSRVFPEMRILFALRDPRDVVVSCFMQSLPLNTKSIHFLTLEDTADEYARTMRFWLKFREMTQNRWLEVRYEDTVNDMENQARKVLAFLSLSWDDRVLDYRQRALERHIHSPTYEAVTKPVYTHSIGRWRNYAKQLEPCLETLQPFIHMFGYDD